MQAGLEPDIATPGTMIRLVKVRINHRRVMDSQYDTAIGFDIESVISIRRNLQITGKVKACLPLLREGVQPWNIHRSGSHGWQEGKIRNPRKIPFISLPLHPARQRDDRRSGCGQWLIA